MGEQCYTLPRSFTDERVQWIDDRWNEGSRITAVAMGDLRNDDAAGWLFVTTNEKVEKSYTHCEAAHKAGQLFFRVHTFPFRMTEVRMEELFRQSQFSLLEKPQGRLLPLREK